MTKRRVRGNGEGSVYRRGRGWAAAVYFPEEGRRQVVYAQHKDEAEAKLRKLLNDRDGGLPIITGKQPLSAFLDRWLSQAKHRVGPRTWDRYEQIVRLDIKPELGHYQLTAMTPRIAQDFFNRLLTEGPAEPRAVGGRRGSTETRRGRALSPQSVTHVRNVLRAVFDLALREGLLARNVVSLTDAPRMTRKEMRPFTEAEARAFLVGVDGDRLEALWVLALTSGCRAGELLGLRWQDLDLERRQVKVEHQLQKVDGVLQLVGLKTARSRRTISLTTPAAEALLDHQQEQRKARLRAGQRWRSMDLVFATELGGPIEGRNLVRSFKAVLRKNRLPDIRFHDLRHSTATLLLIQGVAPRVVMEMLGHSQIALTMNTYSHVPSELQQEAAARLDAILKAH